MVWNLQVRLKTKFIIVFAFSARLPVIAIAAVRLHYLRQRFIGTSRTFEYLVATQWQMGYAIMSSTITGMGPFFRPFEREYATNYRRSTGYGSLRSDMAKQSHNTDVPERTPRSSWRSEGYPMQPISLRRASKATVSDVTAPGDSTIRPTISSNSLKQEPSQASPNPLAPNVLTADANFRPIDNLSRNQSEIWCVDRTTSFETEDGMPIRLEVEKGLVINKRTQFKFEVDRASRVM
jgi:hypothetical protein